MPNCHIFASSHDVLLDDSVLFYNAAKKAGNNNIRLTIWYGAMHIEQAFAKHYDNVIKMPQRKRYLNFYSSKRHLEWTLGTGHLEFVHLVFSGIWN